MNRRHPNHPDRKHARRQFVAGWIVATALAGFLLPPLLAKF